MITRRGHGTSFLIETRRHSFVTAARESSLELNVRSICKHCLTPSEKTEMETKQWVMGVRCPLFQILMSLITKKNKKIRKYQVAGASKRSKRTHVSGVRDHTA